MAAEALGNIPRFDTALADWLACMLYLGLLNRRAGGIGRHAAELLFLGLMSGFMIATGDVPLAWFLPCILVSWILMLLFLRCCGGCSLCDAAYHSARAFILGELAASLEWQLYYYIVGQTDRADPVVRWIVLAATYAVVFGIMYLLERRYNDLDATLRIRPREMFSTVLIAVIIYAASNLSYVDFDTPFSGTLTGEIFNIRTLFDLGGVAILFAHHVQLVEYRRREERDALNAVLHEQYAQYRASQESIDLVNRKYHDLKHQISVLRAQSGAQQARELDRMEEEIRSYEALNKTGNEVLDTILTGKSLTCQSTGITLTCVADGSLLSFMDTMDLCSIFGNALENAVEAVQKLPDGSEKLIHLVVAEKKGLLWIRVENTYDGSWKAEDGQMPDNSGRPDAALPQTTKKDTRYHGYGVRSIYETVRKYDGSARIRTESGWFRLEILIPLQSSCGRT